MMERTPFYDALIAASPSETRWMLQSLVRMRSETEGHNSRLSDSLDAALLAWQIDAAGAESSAATLLELLVTENDQRIRAAVANNPSTPPHLLEQLADGEDPMLRYAAIRNPSLPVDAIERFADDGLFADAVADNPSAPPRVLGRLANSGEFRVRMNVARNERAPQDVLQQLLLDDVPIVRLCSAGNPSLDVQAALSQRTKPDVREVIARRRDLNGEQRERLGRDRSSRVREVVAANAGSGEVPVGVDGPA